MAEHRGKAQDEIPPEESIRAIGAARWGTCRLDDVFLRYSLGDDTARVSAALPMLGALYAGCRRRSLGHATSETS